MKDQCRKMLHYISGHTFQLPSIVRESFAFMIYYPHLNCLVITLTQNLLYLPPLLSFYVMTSFFICAHSIYSLKIFKEGKLWGVDLKAIRNFFVIFFFFVSTLNSIGGVLCSATVSGWLKMRKFLGIYFSTIRTPSLVSRSIIML